MDIGNNSVGIVSSEINTQITLQEASKNDFGDKKENLLCYLGQTYKLLGDLLQSDVIKYSPSLRIFEINLNDLDESSLTRLMVRKVQESMKHIKKLENRIADTRSKVLITGDVNSGKSTLVNSLLDREVLPHDQQPCTAFFCQVMDIKENLNKREEIHAAINESEYDQKNPESFSIFDIEKLKEVDRATLRKFGMWKVYCRDNRIPSLLNNGLVDLTLIDSPGLNQDLTKTLAVYAQQEEIDAVIFVVNAENHFTLSGTQFIMEAKKEKPYMFIVINRFDQIIDKIRCKTEIMEQIKELMPHLEESDNLIHFISAKDPKKSTSLESAFEDFEVSLHSFLLEKRSKSKLAPAQNYLFNILNDISKIAEYNLELARVDLNSASLEISETKPLVEKLNSSYELILSLIEETIFDSTRLIQLNSKEKIDKFISNVAISTEKIKYPGIFFIVKYANTIIASMNSNLEEEFYKMQDFASEKTLCSVNSLYKIAEKDIPCWEGLCTRSPIDVKLIHNLTGNMIKFKFEMSDLFEMPEKLTLSISAVTLIGGLSVGYKAVSGSFLKLGSLILGDSKKVVLGCFVVGSIGASLSYFLYDARDRVKRKVNRKIRKYIRENEEINGEILRISSTSSKVLESSVFEFKSSFRKALDYHENIYEEQCTRQKKAQETKLFFHRIYASSKGLLDILEDKK